MSRERPNWAALVDVIGAAASVDDIDRFGPAVLEAIESVVPYDIGSFNEIDPDAGRAVVCARPEAALTGPDQAEQFAGLAYQNPLVMYQRRTSDGSAKRISDFIDRRQLHRLELYQQIYKPLGVEYQVALGLPARRPLVVGIALNRSRRDFADRELLVLDLLRPHLIQCYRNARSLSTMEAVTRGLEEVGRSAVILAGDGEVSATDWALARLAYYFGPPPSGPLPTAVVSWLATQRVRPASGGEPVLCRPLTANRGDGRLTARFIGRTGDRPEMIVLEESASNRGPDQLRELGLTNREADILWILTQGRSVPEVAVHLGVSPATVNKHLQHVYRKLGVSSRSAAIASACDAIYSDR